MNIGFSFKNTLLGNLAALVCHLPLLPFLVLVVVVNRQVDVLEAERLRNQLEWSRRRREDVRWTSFLDQEIERFQEDLEGILAQHTPGGLDPRYRCPRTIPPPPPVTMLDVALPTD